MVRRLSILSVLAGALLLAAPMQAAADKVVFADFVDVGVNNDCPNYFGAGGVSTCDVGLPLGVEISPIIMKIGPDGNPDHDADELDELHYPSVTGDEFTINDSTWSYSPDDAEDPTVRFWSIKQGTVWRLYWVVPDDAPCADPSSLQVNYNVGCLTAALPVTSGTLDNGPYAPGGQYAFSHITFFNGGDPTDPPCMNGDCEPPVVPEPASLLLLGSGLAGVAAVARRRRKNSTRA